MPYRPTILKLLPQFIARELFSRIKPRIQFYAGGSRTKKNIIFSADFERVQSPQPSAMNIHEDCL